MKSLDNKPHKYEVADILREHISDFQNNNILCMEQYKAVRDIIECRTAKMKGHLSRCNSCGHIEQSYNSCRNRHCNKCQYLRQVAWAEKVRSRVFPVKYFHLVFTVPDSLNPLFYLNQRICYNLMFNVAWSVLRDLCKNPRFLGADTGAITMLHTWSSTLTYHPHIHMLVPAGGLSADGMEWVKAKRNFLVPVKLLSKIYRARFCSTVKELLADNKLRIPDKMEKKTLLKNLFSKQWVVYAKKTGDSSDRVIEYLARYTNRVAITNQRIKNYDGKNVTFRYKNHKTGIFDREMTLEAGEFIRRFLQHILPERFYKVRYMGIFASVNIKENTDRYLEMTGQSMHLSTLEGLNSYEVLRHIRQEDPLLCKCCKKGKMIPVQFANTG
ncbi:MAG TPA: IS91 family transposase [Bacteroidales bacterium]|nr:IS91 family transposase [Bacteroidales bacterium]